MKRKSIYKILIIIAVLGLGIESFADFSWWVRTPKGSLVSVTVMTYELSQSEINDLNTQFQNAYPNAWLVGNSSRKYNCYSYALYRQDTNNNIWMPDATPYVTDGSYVLRPGSTFFSGDIACYYMTVGGVSAPVHDAIVWGTGDIYNVVCFSKWGIGPLMMHWGDDCPYWFGGGSSGGAIPFYRNF